MAQQQTAQSPVGGLLGEKERRLLEKSVIVRLVEKSGLKPIGDVAQRLLAVLSGPEPDTENVCRLFERDPSLASNVLRIANSPLYRAAETIDDIRTAVVRLGFEAVKELVIVHVHNGILKDSTATASFYRAHSAACAAIARELAAMFAPEEDEGLFSSGLLHDVGKLVLLQGGQQLYKTTLDATDMREPEETLDLERAELGYDHAALGGLVLEHWAIPSPVPEVVALHHVDTAKIEIEHLVKKVALVAIADWLDPAVSAGDACALEAALESMAEKRPDLSGFISAADLVAAFDRLVDARKSAVSLL